MFSGIQYTSSKYIYLYARYDLGLLYIYIYVNMQYNMLI